MQDMFSTAYEMRDVIKNKNIKEISLLLKLYASEHDMQELCAMIYEKGKYSYCSLVFGNDNNGQNGRPVEREVRVIFE